MGHNSSGSGRSQYIEIGLGFCECVVLDTGRHFLLSYTKQDHPHWETALELCDRNLGDAFGPLTSASVLDVIRALRRSRNTCFQFNNPYGAGCRVKLTDCERLLFRTLRFVRTGDTSRGRMEALILCEGFDTRALLVAMDRLASLLPNVPVSGLLRAKI